MAEKEKKVSEVADKKKKPVKEKKEKKPNKLIHAWKGFKSELKKIVWPTWKQVLKGTGVVLLVVIVCAIALGGLDSVFTKAMKSLFDLF